MQVTFKGICTHVHGMVEGNVPHHVMLPAARNYTVKDLIIPDHTPLLSLAPSDVVNGDLGAFGQDLRLLASGSHVIEWDITGCRIRLEGLGEQLVGNDLPELPHLCANVEAELDPAIVAGERPESVAAIIEIKGGTLQSASDGAGRIAVLSAMPSQPWQLELEKAGAVRVLTLRADAVLSIANTDQFQTTQCDEVDYLLHYRLTNRPYVESTDFMLPDMPSPAPVILDPMDSTTLTNCSNSIYP